MSNDKESGPDNTQLKESIGYKLTDPLIYVIFCSFANCTACCIACTEQAKCQYDN